MCLYAHGSPSLTPKQVRSRRTEDSAQGQSVGSLSSSGCDVALNEVVGLGIVAECRHSLVGHTLIHCSPCVERLEELLTSC